MLLNSPGDTAHALERCDSFDTFNAMRNDRAHEFRMRFAVENALAELARLTPFQFQCTLHQGPSHCRLGPTEIANWREGLSCEDCNLNARMRFGMQLMLSQSAKGRESDVYLTEQATFGFVAARRIFAHASGSEYVPEPERRVELQEYIRTICREDTLRIAHEDATRLSFEDARFDAIGSFDVLEHIVSYRAALREFARVLKPDGVLVLTAPFRNDLRETLVRARLGADGSVEHLLDPEYHGDPVSEGGVLCYYHFGWDLLEALREAGFGRAEVVSTWSPAYGFLGDLSTFVAWRT
jgi:SAM-dependent methyltransferase